MMGMAEAGEKAGLSQKRKQTDEFRRALESATSSILNAEAFRKPYPLIRFRDFFPSDFYARLVQSFPDVDRFAGLNGDGTRREYALYDERSDPGSEESRELWSIVRRVLASTEVASALREKLDEGFRIRARRSGEGWPVPMHPRPVLYTDLNGYAIKPHPDTRRKVLTMQIYLPSDDLQRELGTAIYKISPMGVFAWKSYGLVKDKTVPFLPNSGYAFVVIHPAFSLLRSSWHGREAISVPVEKPRLSILNTYYRDPSPQPNGGHVRNGWPRRPASSAHREVPKRAPDAALRRIFERRGIEMGEMAGRAIVWPAETNLHLARPLDDELLHRSWIVSCGDRGAEAADRPILVEPEPAVARGHPNQMGGRVIGDDEGPEFAFAPVIALTRHRPSRPTRRCGAEQRGECDQGETGVGHSAWSSEDRNAKRCILSGPRACESAKFPQPACGRGGPKAARVAMPL